MTDQPTMTLAAWLDEWLEVQQTRLQPATWASYRGLLHRHVLAHVGDTPLAGLEPAQLTRLYQHLIRRGSADGEPLSLRTVRYVHSILHKALGDAGRQGLLDRNPSELADVPRRDLRAAGPRELTAWDAGQLRAFLAATAGDELGPLWALAAGTGMRRGELLGLTWSAVDLERRTIQVRRALAVVRRHAELKKPKNGRSRTITIDSRAADVLREQARLQAAHQTQHGPTWRNDWNLVFTAPTGRPLTPDHVSRCFRRAVEASGLPRLRFHDLRHTHATLMLEAGVPIKVVSERLGHATVQLTLDIYAHVLPAMDSEAVARFAAHVYTEPDAGAAAERGGAGGAQVASGAEPGAEHLERPV